MKKLYKSATNKTLCGVIGGIAAHLGVDATILRVAYLALVVFTGFVPGIIVYIGAYLLIPDEPTTVV